MLNDAMPLNPSTPQVNQRRDMLYYVARNRIGTKLNDRGNPTLVRDNIAAYLMSIGCPEHIDGALSLLSIKDSKLRNAVDDCAQAGKWIGHAGWALSLENGDAYPTALEYAAVACSEFLRRGNVVAWRTADAVATLSPRHFDSTDEALDINDEIHELTWVYQLLVIDGVRLLGYSDHEERNMIRVLNERFSRLVPTLLIVPPVTQSGDSPLTQFILSRYYTVVL